MSTLPEWFGAEEDWERPAPQRDEVRRDIRYAVIALVVALFSLELFRSLGALENESLGIAWQYVAVISLAALVGLRRVAPVIVTLLAGIHLFAAGTLVPMTVSSLTIQLLYFLLIFSGVAWARDRRALMAAVAMVLILMAAWLAWSYAVGSGIETIREEMATNQDWVDEPGPFSPVVAVILLTLLTNALFFGFAIVLGQVAWRGALRQHQVREQAHTISQQSVQLRDRAVMAERMRIARELHDVVAHHVSVMGVQAAAARLVMDKNPDAARESLAAVEESSREAVGQMRGLLGTLRSEDLQTDPAEPNDSADGRGQVDRSPHPTLDDLEALAARSATPTCQVDTHLVENPQGAAAQVPPPVQLSTYRIVQEAIANVHRHSTARRIGVTVRVDVPTDELEVEVVDDGHAKFGTSGSGLGLLGMQERAEHLGGGTEIGPRNGEQGWRVRVWFPLNASPQSSGQAQTELSDLSVPAK